MAGRPPWNQFNLHQRAMFLESLTGLEVHALQMEHQDDEIEANVRAWGTEIDLEQFIQGAVRPRRLLVLFRGPDLCSRPALYEMSAAYTAAFARLVQKVRQQAAPARLCQHAGLQQKSPPGPR
jgi:hypothetical protein